MSPAGNWPPYRPNTAESGGIPAVDGFGRVGKVDCGETLLLLWPGGPEDLGLMVLIAAILAVVEC
jgi:hypothetical protein